MAADVARPAVVLLSGGMDSSVLLHHVARKLGYSPVHGLSCDYGQRHARELECARRQAAAAGVVRHHVVAMPFLADLVKEGTALVTGGPAVPDLDALDVGERRQPPTYVPNRNMILLSMAAAYAEAQGIADVFYGAQAQDEYGYWDCTPDFVERLNAALALNRHQCITIHAPFATAKKADIVRLGMALGVDFADTWTCYRGGDLACGACPTCVERRKAFRAAGFEDPLAYIED
ncbi:MAG TPA: 7-cyano-7-deazaguanine synthase QueC [Candidatus Hydrogenedentes bacterium]|nr:7-cyano-7-deazaguanine synthase QueC [Candidatus Hydrogenedentota bacterium]